MIRNPNTIYQVWCYSAHSFSKKILHSEYFKCGTTGAESWNILGYKPESVFFQKHVFFPPSGLITYLMITLHLNDSTSKGVTSPCMIYDSIFPVEGKVVIKMEIVYSNYLAMSLELKGIAWPELLYFIHSCFLHSKTFWFAAMCQALG